MCAPVHLLSFYLVAFEMSDFNLIMMMFGFIKVTLQR